MSLNVERALKEGIARTATRNGLVLVVLIGTFSAVSSVAYNSMMRGLVPESMQQEVNLLGPTLPISPSVAGGALLVAYLLSFVLTAAALRTFVTEETRTIPREYFTRNLGWFVLNYLVGLFVFGLAVSIGFLLLVVPGVFLMVSLYFWIVFVAVEDQNFVEGFGNSWTLTKGNRWSLLGLGLVVLVPGGVMFGAVFVVSAAFSAWLTLVAMAVGYGVFGVFSWATTARAYVQLIAADTTDGTAATA